MPVQTRSATKSIQAAISTGRIIIEIRFRCEKTCAICMQNMYGDKVYHLPCGHTFHCECFKNQLRHMRHNPDKCACCRHDLLPALRQNDILYELMPPRPTERSQADEFFELVAIYNLITANENRIINRVILRGPIMPLQIPEHNPIESWPEPPVNSTEPPTNSTVQPNNNDNVNQDNSTTNESDDSRDSEDIWFNNSRSYYRSRSNVVMHNNTDISYNIVNNATTDQSSNIVDNSTNYLDNFPSLYMPMPYGNYEIEDESYDDMPELVSPETGEEGVDPYDIDMESYEFDYGTTPSLPSDTDTDSDSNDELTVFV